MESSKTIFLNENGLRNSPGIGYVTSYSKNLFTALLVSRLAKLLKYCPAFPLRK